MTPVERAFAGARALASLTYLLCACGSDHETPSSGMGGAAGSGGMAGSETAGSGGMAGSGVAGAAGGETAGSGGVAGSETAGSGGAGAGGSAGSAGSGQGGSPFTLTSPAFSNVEGCSVENPAPCEVFPDQNVSYMGNANVSPELSWTGVPAGTRSFALVLRDVTYGQAHWALWNIPADVSMLAANVQKDTATPAVPAGSRQANANFATEEPDGYFGPHLPCNVFAFDLYALSLDTFSPMDPESSVLVAIELQDLGEPVLGLATLTGRSNDYGTVCE